MFQKDGKALNMVETRFITKQNEIGDLKKIHTNKEIYEKQN